MKLIKFDVGNYRSMFLLSNIIKLLEKIGHERSDSFLEKHNYLYKYEFNSITSVIEIYAVIEITEKI